MAKDIKNLRTYQPSMTEPKDVKSTDMLKGEASKTPAESETNSTTQYTNGGKPSGPFGGEGTQS